MSTSEVTVEELAKKIGDVSQEKLIHQLSNIGINVNSSSDVLSETQVKKLLAMQEEDLNKDNENNAPKKISLKRKTVSTIKVKRASGKNATVNVVRKKRKIYVKKTPEEAKKLLLEENDDVNQDTVMAEQEPEETNIGVVEDVAGSVVEVTETVSDKEKSDEITIPQVVPQPDVNKKANDKPANDKPANDKPANDKPANDKAANDKTANDNAASKKKKSHSNAEGEDSEENARKKKKGKTSSKDAKKTGNWKKQVTQALTEEYEEEGATKSGKNRRRRGSHNKVNPHAFSKPIEAMTYDIEVTDGMSVAEIAKAMSLKAAVVIKALMGLGVMANINEPVEQDTAVLVVEELGHKAVIGSTKSIEDTAEYLHEGEASARDPVITVMGHVDHGKTTLLDYIRNANVAGKESGGITQHMAAYRAKTSQGYMTFLDTPGHSAFTAMRARGANCTDIVILVVAADDGVMPQTKEAIQHAQAANAPIVIAINKIDKPDADTERVTSELAQLGLMPESWGGDTIFCHISAKEGTGIPELLETVRLLAEVLELKAHNTGYAKGIVLESRLDKGKGPVSTVLVQSGTVSKGDVIIAGVTYGRVRQMLDESGNELQVAGPSIPIEVTGLACPSSAGDVFQVVNDDKVARELSQYRGNELRLSKLSRQRTGQLDGFMTRMQESTDEVKQFNLLVKADVQGSVEVLKETLEELSTAEFKIKVISSGVGGFNESDVRLSLASDALLIGFNVRADATARKLAQEEGATFHYYSIIYDIIDGVKQILSGKIGPKYEDKIIGLAFVRDVFKSSKMGAIAGCIVEEGTIRKGSPIRILRESVVIYQGELESLRRFKDGVDDVKSGVECGIGIKQYNDIKPGDQIEVSERIRVDVVL
ncbi:MAG: translation initiation factor IF-2 [Francisellaceae bacterium]|nr:translation initiation factor IF-2 [Francisellaceae bacterium]